MGWLMGLEPKRPGNEGIVMGRLYEGKWPLRHPSIPRIYPRIYPTASLLGYSNRSAWLPARTKMICSASPLPLSR